MSRNSLHNIVATSLYTVLIGIVSTVFVPSNAQFIFGFPAFVVLAIAVHAVNASYVAEFGYLTILVFVSVLALSIGVGVVEELLFPGEVSIVLPGIAGTVTFTILLVIVYWLLINANRSERV
ncbi:hypothetical protein [Haloferax chudinovii]|uniref:Uncharacterized protein n=1 Tax=Haloferax chudinovii TaxID=1109010 RepID=A0ABD5XMK3_9EURY